MNTTLWGHVGNFFYSNFFVGVVALGVGAAAYSVYKKQKRDAKRDAANVILLEIESAEKQLQLINQTQSSGTLAENIYLMKSSTWDENRYMFVRDFDSNEWDKITDFYNKCLQYDASVAYNNTFFGNNVEKVQNQVLRVLAKYADSYSDKLVDAKSPQERKLLKREYEEKKNRFIETYGVIENEEGFPPPYFYNPMKPVNDAKAVLGAIETNLSLTSVGIKLKRMAIRRSPWQRIRSYIGGNSSSI